MAIVKLLAKNKNKKKTEMTKKIAVHDTKYLCIERITFNTARSSPQLLLRMSVVNHYQINHQYLCLFTWRFIFGSFFFVAVVSFSSRLENSKTLKRFWCISNHCSVQNSDSGILRAMFGFKNIFHPIVWFYVRFEYIFALDKLQPWNSRCLRKTSSSPIQYKEIFVTQLHDRIRRETFIVDISIKTNAFTNIRQYSSYKMYAYFLLNHNIHENWLKFQLAA